MVTWDGFYVVVLKERRETPWSLLLLVTEDDEDSYEAWVPAEQCVPVHGGWGSYERCEALDDEVLCQRWAARSVTAIPVDGRGHELVDGDGYALPGLVPERRAVCWEHLGAAVFWAGERFGRGRSEVRLGDVAGGSWEQPVRFDEGQFGGSWGASYTLPARGVEAVGG